MSTALFSPLSLRELTLANRIAVSPMCQYSAKDGNASDWHLMHLGNLSVSGPGLVMVEATAVEPRGRITYGDLGLYSDDNEAALRRIVAFCRQYGGSRLGLQLAHAGRKASDHLPWEEHGRPLSPEEGAWTTVGPSKISYGDAWPRPEALDGPGLQAVKQAFVRATRRAARLDFDLVELHAAHGYLLHEFLSPLSNVRHRRLWRQPGKAYAVPPGGVFGHAGGLAGPVNLWECGSPPRITPTGAGISAIPWRSPRS